MADIREQADELCRSWRELMTMYEECAKAVGLSYSGLNVLSIIYANDQSCTQKMIAEETLYPKQTVNAIIRGFWKDGLIRQTEVSTDRRNKTIHLTKAGKAFADKVVPQIMRAETKALEKLAAKQRQDFIQGSRQYLQRFRECLSEHFDIK